MTLKTGIRAPGAIHIIDVDEKGKAVVPAAIGAATLSATTAGYEPLSLAAEAFDPTQAYTIYLTPLHPSGNLSVHHIRSLQRADSMLFAGYIVDDESGRPLRGVTVNATPSQTSAVTDETGFFWLVVPVPSVAVGSLTQRTELLFHKAGFQDERLLNVESWQGGGWVLRIRLVEGVGEIVRDEAAKRFREQDGSEETAEHDSLSAPLFQALPEGLLSNSPKATTIHKSQAFTVRVPKYIRVKTDSGVDVLPFDFQCSNCESYLTDVLPSEWPPLFGDLNSGGMNALLAGAVAVRTYATYFVNHPLSTSYDICGTTACQQFISHNNSPNTDLAVQQTEGSVLTTASGAIAFSEFSKENNNHGCGDGYTGTNTDDNPCIYDPVCLGVVQDHTHGRGMCQDGSGRWATGFYNLYSQPHQPNGQPLQTWEWILGHYYPHFTITTGRSLMVGDRVQVFGTGSSGLAVHRCGDGGIASGVSCPLLANEPDGSIGTIVGGPTVVTADGNNYTWWKVQWDAANLTGWSVENWLALALGMIQPPTNVGQFQYADLSHPIPRGGAATGGGVSLLGTIVGQSGEQVRLEIELLSGCGGFSGQPNHLSAYVPSGATPEIDIPNLIDGNYRWQARTHSASGNTSAWVSSGGSVDFLVQVHACIVPCGASGIAEKAGCQVPPPPPSVTLTANPGSVSPGNSSTLTWNSSNATSCLASGSWSGSRATSGTATVSPSATSTYTLTCTGAGGSASKSATITFTTSPVAVYLSAFPDKVTAGTPVGLGWATSNAASCTGSGGWSGAQPLSGGTTVFPSTTTTYTLTCTGTGGGSGSASVTVTVTSSQPSVNLALTPPAIDPGGSATLQWSTTAMTSCTASNGWSGSKPLSGSQQVSPASTTTYTLNCLGTAPASQELVRNGSFSGTVTEWSLTGKFFANSAFGSCNLTCLGYAYLSDPSGSLSLSNNLFGTMSQDISLPSTASSISLSYWVSVSTLETSTTTPFDVLSLTLQNSQGTPLQLIQTFSNLNAGGYRLNTFDLTPYKGQTIRLQFVGTTDTTLGTIFRVDDVSVQASLPPQQYSANATLTVNAPTPPGLAFTATPDIVTIGQTSTLTWSSSGTTSCTASSGWSGTKSTSGNQVVAPGATTTYTLSCSGPGGTASSSVTVVVQAPPPGGYPINVSTGTADQITQTSAVLHGIANPNGASTSAVFLYGPFPALGHISSSATLGASAADQAFAIVVNGLSCGTKYQYLADASNAYGESNGAALTFNTLSCPGVSTIFSDGFESGNLCGWSSASGGLSQCSRSISFAPKMDLQTGTEPLGLVVTDLDGDGRRDIAVTIYNNGSGDHLTIFRNTGTVGHPQFDAPLDIPTGRGPEGMAAGDLNNDGKPDLVVANPGDSTISVLRNSSTPGFIKFDSVPLSLSSPPTPHQIAIADFDGDGKPDLIITSNNGRLVSIFHHASDPNTIAFDYRRDFGVNGYLNDLAVADIDRDTKPEILIPITDTGLLTVFQNTSSPGNVLASALAPLAAGAAPIRGLAAGDLNNDHAADVVIAAVGGVGIFQNSSSPGVFNLSRTDLPTGTNPGAVAIGDLDNDGISDVVVANPSDNTLIVLRNASTGSPIILTPLALRPITGLNPINFVLGDVNGDGWLDIIVANHDGSSVSIFLNTTGNQ